MLQDRQGFIWYGTRQGLYKYDGYKIERFANEYGKKNTLSENYVTGLAQDANGRIWISTKATGLNCYDPVQKKYTVYRHKDGDKTTLNNDHVNRVFTDSRNRLWTGTEGKGWDVYDIKAKSFSNFQSALSFTDFYGTNASNSPTWFEEDRQGSVWICTNFGLHCQDAAGRITSYRDKNRNNNSQSDNLFTCSYLSDDTTLWLGTWAAGLKKFNTRTKEFSQYTFDKINPLAAIHNIVLHIAPKSKDQLWVGTADKGLGVFNMHTGTFTFIPHDPSDIYSPLAGECNGMLVDRNGILWVGYNSGISKRIPQCEYFNHVPIKDVPQEYKGQVAPVAFYMDTTSGCLFTGCIAGKGLYMINEKSGSQQVIQLPGISKKEIDAGGITIESIVPTNTGRLLLSSNKGLYTFTLTDKKIKCVVITDQENKPLSGITTLIRAKDGYWANAGFNNGFYSIDGDLTKAVHYYKGAASPVALNRNDVWVLLDESDTCTWITKRDVGLFILNRRNNTIKQVGGPEVATYGGALCKQDGDHYWLSSMEHGVFYVTRNTGGQFSFRHFGQKQGLISDFVDDMCMDNRGNVWVATPKGPAVAVAGSFKFIGFSEYNGFIKRFPVLTALAKLADGRICVGLKGQYVTFYPDSVTQSGNGPDIYLTSLKIFDKEWNDTVCLDSVRKIELAYNQNFLSAQFISPEYTDPAGVAYAYKMDGIDKDWEYAGSRRYLSYSGMQPGSYLLHIKAANSRGVWGAREITLSIIVHPPFWKTWWFTGLCILAVAGIILLLVRLRINQVKAAAEMQAAFNKKMAEVEMKALRAQMNPHFLFNCLNSINRFIVTNDTVKASNYLTKFSKLIRLILDNSSADSTTLENEINLLRLYVDMETMRFDGKFSYTIETDNALATETIIIPSMIIQPYLENAIWHGLMNKGNNGHLLLKFSSVAANELEVVIEDDGVGRAMAEELKSKSTLKNKSYGMQITNDRIKVLNQLYDATSKVTVEDLRDSAGRAAGTRVTLRIPYNGTANDTSNSIN